MDSLKVTSTRFHIYLYIFVCLCVCVCMCVNIHILFVRHSGYIHLYFFGDVETKGLTEIMKLRDIISGESSF